MADMEFEVVGLNELVIKLQDGADNLNTRVFAALAFQILYLHATVNERMAALFHNPEKMQQSVTHSSQMSADGASGEVVAEGLPYLAIQEYGGTTSAHDIYPVTASVLAFMWPSMLNFSGGPKNSEMAFFRSVKHPGSRLPERSYMRSALAMRKQNILEAIKNAAADF